MSSKERFEDYKPIVTRSQCHNCENNESVTDCEVYEVKPEKYRFNKEKCPEYKKE